MTKRTCLWIAIVACGGGKPPAAKPAEPDYVVANRYLADHSTGGIAGPPPLVGPPPTVCDVYLAALERMIACDKVPQDDREAMRKSHDQVIESLEQEATAEEKQAEDDACKQGNDAVTRAAVSLGC